MLNARSWRTELFAHACTFFKLGCNRKEKNNYSCYLVDMKRRSNKFQPGQRLAGTMLTVVDSLNPLSWDDVIVDCDCGNRVTIPYMAAYRRQFSCGCKSRLRQNAPDATGQRYFNKAGNVTESPNDGRPIAHGRGLTNIMRDPDTQRWIYLCECCAETFIMPGGHDRTPASDA